MKSLNIREMRSRLGELEELLDREGEVLVTRRGRPIARLLPIEPQARPRGWRSLKWLRDQMAFQEVGSEVLIREDRDARG
ncbi:MAG: type II toxin-antitoxin system Phd/YefM family antitoxin [Burkholderiales bacterium]